MGIEKVFELIGSDGILVFFLLWRDAHKDSLMRGILDKNAAVLTEIATVIRERMPRQ